MRGLRFFFVAILVVGSAAVARAADVDISDPQCPSGTGAGCPANVGFNQAFQFMVNSTGGGIFQGTNESAQGWNSLLFVFSSAGVGPISCTSGANGNAPFQSPCARSTENDGTLIDLFYTACAIESCRSGIPNNDIFTINMNDLGLSTGSWPVGLLVRGYFNTNPGFETPPSGGFVTLTTVPEPATLTLLGVGIGALAAKRRFQRQRHSRS